MREVGGGRESVLGVERMSGCMHACMWIGGEGGGHLGGGGGGTVGAKGWRERFGPQFVVTGSCVGVGATQRGLRTGFVSIDR